MIEKFVSYLKDILINLKYEDDPVDDTVNCLRKIEVQVNDLIEARNYFARKAN
jgi:hypothetical protein